MPTGVHLRDARRQLFDAAERVLVAAGPGALTSRAVTAEAGCAKGVLHRHFADFDDFLAEFVLDRIDRLDGQAGALREAAGTGTVVDNLTGAVVDLFESVALAVSDLVTARDAVRARLSDRLPAGVPVLTEAAILIGGYLTEERALGRIAAAADVDTLAAMLVGTGHLLFAGRERPLDAEAVRAMVTSVVGRDTTGR